jgi:hypothetical protein
VICYEEKKQTNIYTLQGTWKHTQSTLITNSNLELIC